MKLDARLPGGENCSLEIQVKGEQATVTLAGQSLSFWFRKLSASHCLIQIDGRVIDAVVHRDGAAHTVIAGGRTYCFELFDGRLRRSSEEESGDGAQSVKAQMPGRVVKVLKAAGASVKKNDGVLVLEAMKMQNEVHSPRSGALSQVMVGEGESVSAGQILFEVK